MKKTPTYKVVILQGSIYKNSRFPQLVWLFLTKHLYVKKSQPQSGNQELLEIQPYNITTSNTIKNFNTKIRPFIASACMHAS